MKPTVLLMIILVKQGLNGQTVTLSSCRHNKTIELMFLKNNDMMNRYQLKLGLSNLTCFTSNVRERVLQNVQNYLKDFDCNCRPYPPQDLHPTVTTMHSDATTDADRSSIAQICQKYPQPISNPTPSKQKCSITSADIIQAILGVLVGLLAVLLIISWVYICLLKKKLGATNINKLNTR